MKTKYPITPIYKYKQNYQPLVNRDTVYHSPKHCQSPNTNITMDYHSFMQNQKKHPKRQQTLKNSNKQLSNSIPVSNSNVSLIQNRQSIMLTTLVNQNDFLIKELLIQKQKEEEYRHLIKKLTRCRSHQNIQPSRPTQKYQQYMHIDERSTAPRQSSRAYEQIYQYGPSHVGVSDEQQQKICKHLLDQSMSYIKHSKKALSHEIDELNDKLCRLIERSSTERDPQLRKQLRVEMSECVKQLQQLKKHFQTYYQ